MALQGGKSGVGSVTLDHEKAEIAPQDTLTLKATVLDANGQELTDETLTWSSSNAAVATVKDGVVTGVTEGKAKITVKAGKRSADCTVTVTNDAIEVKRRLAHTHGDHAARERPGRSRFLGQQ